MLCKCFIIRQHCWATVQQRDKLKRVSGTCPMSVAFAVASTYYVCFASTELPVLGTSILQAPKRSHLQLSITKNWEHSCWLQKTLKVRQSIWEHSFFFSSSSTTSWSFGTSLLYQWNSHFVVPVRSRKKRQLHDLSFFCWVPPKHSCKTFYVCSQFAVLFTGTKKIILTTISDQQSVLPNKKP